MRKYRILLSLAISSGVLAYGQITQVDFDKSAEFRKAKNLYYTDTFLAANYEFNDILDNENYNFNDEEAAEYYAALTSLVTDQPNAEKAFLSFEEKYPKSAYLSAGTWDLGSFYLKKGDYDKAFQYLTAQDLSDLPERKRTEFQFKLGYVYLMKGDNDMALKYLEPLTNSDLYENEANYYVGHIYYERREFDKAMQYFSTLENLPEYESKTLPYLVQIEYNNGNYQKAIVDAKRLLQQNDSDFIQSEGSKIIGESYFALGQYGEAIPYLEAYKGELSYADYYQLGYAYYEQKDYDKAVSYFNKIVSQDQAWAQTAYFQLGNAYMKTDKKQQALAAYQSAANMDYDRNLQEEAFYNYAKLSYDIGNPYQPAAEALQDFVEKYPYSTHNAEINDYLADAYLSAGNYKSAVAILSQIRNKTQAQKKTEQMAAFLYGTELFKEGDLTASSTQLIHAAKLDANTEITQRAYFWLGEIAYKQGDYNKALSYFKKPNTATAQFPEKKEINYQLGYTYLKLKQYPQAVNAFKQYLASNPPGDFRSDAQLRLADSYIGTKNNTAALQIYSDLVKSSSSNKDEAAYNRAIVLGITGDTSQKATALENFVKKYPNSKFNAQAQLELADAYTQLNKNQQAILTLNHLIKNNSGDLKAEARLRKGLILYNEDKKNQALKEYQTIVEEYPKTAIAQQAIENAKQIYIDQGNFRGFENWASGIDFYEVDTAEVQSLAFDSAMQKFDAKEYAAAIPLLKSYTAQYPSGSYFYKSNYALGESYYQTKDYNNAIAPLTRVATGGNENQDDALLRLSQIYLQQNKKTEALLSLESLEKVSNNPDYTAFAEAQLMRIYSDKGQHQQAVAMADKVLANKKNELSLLQEAELTKARNLINSKSYKRAKKAYQNLEKASNAAIRAEALYYKAFFLNKDKKYEASNAVIFDLASQYAEYQRWGSKSLVLMAENYYHLGDLYQANYTLDSVIENYTEFPNVVAEAKALKQKIKQ